MKIGALVPTASQIWAGEIERLNSLFPDAEFFVGETEVRKAFDKIEALIASRLTEEMVGQAPSLKALFLPIAGLNAIPLELLAARGVRVFNVHANAESVAQNALAMILAWFGRTIEYHNDLRAGRWHGFWVGKGAEDEWDTIFDRRVAILGTGAIGSALAALLKPFRCEITGWRRRSDLPPPPGFDRVEGDLAVAVTGRDIVVSTLPLAAATAGVIDARIFEAMRGSFFVNVGRGATVDEEALWTALRERRIAGAGIDVWYRYPEVGATSGPPSRFPIHELPNVVLSPHVGGSTHQASKAAIEASCRNLADWMAGREAANEVDLRNAY